MRRINPAARSDACAAGHDRRRRHQLAHPDHCGACWAGGTAPPSGMTDMQNNRPPAHSSGKSILIAAIIALAVLFGAYHVGKDMALRDNARQSAGR
ncbi:hypothetical protein [Stenotrophomonas indicatrix]|uniref:hypothetical protein n=1 Tax=Stenotrophomonas indicatrix TaxID=2045451 RepID=UPI00111E3ADB|nr:hypothetical protein [Stenotrophomonas indicatrix]MBO1746397.1 hypothetical protein [Stenotrophomonas indicatrix]MDN8644436.1 hypothetical protein [Stenotrophomonas indicatrix]MDN8655217.1 hypothetical protein [Stenotrophomonas indicatrix]TPD98637.1 hypothetical protein FJP65_06590 [Stenotrophomonas maltophilia]